MASLDHHYTRLLPLLLSILLFFPSPNLSSSASDFLAPLLSPFLDDICKDAFCGKGKCKTSVNSNFNFTCECDAGWKQVRRDDDDDKHFRFLPCVIPNCTLNYTCGKAEAPAPETRGTPTNKSIFDPCSWVFCGEGSCIKTEKLSHRCECKQGYSNLLNISSLPCFSDCALGMDCENLGITVSNESAPTSPSSSSDRGTNLASSISSGSCLWLTFFMMVMVSIVAMVPWS